MGKGWNDAETDQKTFVPLKQNREGRVMQQQAWQFRYAVSHWWK